MNSNNKSFNFQKAVTPTLFDYNKLNYNKNYFVTNWGDTFYEEVIQLIEGSPIAKSLINNIVQRIIGKGVYNKTTDKKDTALTNLLYKVTIDYIYFNQFSIKNYWNVPHTKVMKIEHEPIKNIRYTMDENIVACSENWGARNKKIEAYQTFNSTENTDSEQLFVFKNYTVENRVYPLPFWFSSSEFIMIDKLIGTGLLNSMNNGLTASFMVVDNSGERSEEEFEAIYESIKKNYSGQENAGGFVLLNASSKENGIEILPFPSNANKENYEFINILSSQKILQGFGINSPILVGLEQQGQSLGNGTEMIAANEIFMNTYILPKRELIWGQLEELFSYSTIDLSQYEVKNGDFLIDNTQPKQ
jgi:hypothetical protein